MQSFAEFVRFDDFTQTGSKAKATKSLGLFSQRLAYNQYKYTSITTAASLLNTNVLTASLAAGDDSVFPEMNLQRWRYGDRARRKMKVYFIILTISFHVHPSCSHEIRMKIYKQSTTTPQSHFVSIGSRYKIFYSFN